MKSAILHTDKEGLIGCGGELAYRSKEDFQFFQQYTQGRVLVMGKNTYAECGNLPGRLILSLSSSGNLLNGDTTACGPECFSDFILCGGPAVYSRYLHLCEEVVVNFTKQPPRPPGGAPSYFDLVQLHRLFRAESITDYQTFTNVRYTPKHYVSR